MVQGQVRFNRVPEKVPEKVGEGLVQSQVRLNRVPEKVPEKVPGSIGAKPSQAQQGSGEGSREGLGGFGAARSGSTGFRRRLQRRPEKVAEKAGEGCREGRRRFWESLMQGQVRFQQVQQNSSAWLHRKIKRCGC